MHWSLSDAQGNISIECKEINLFETVPLMSEPISEDDPGDLAEATSFLLSFYDRKKVVINHSNYAFLPEWRHTTGHNRG